MSTTCDNVKLHLVSTPWRVHCGEPKLRIGLITIASPRVRQTLCDVHMGAPFHKVKETVLFTWIKPIRHQWITHLMGGPLIVSSVKVMLDGQNF